MIDRRGLGLLALGAVLFCAVFYFATTRHILGWPADDAEGSIEPQYLVALYTIAFGLPYALGELARRTNWLAIFYLIVLVPAVHLGAIIAFLWYTNQGQDIGTTENVTLFGGLIAGAAGAALSFLLLFVLGLRARTAGIAVFAAGFVLLTACGGLGLKYMPEAPEQLDAALRLFLPWQLIFAFFLSALLRPSPKRGEVATTV